jgi:putative transposase
MIKLTYQYKIKPTKQQIRQFELYLNICRGVYNYALAEKKAWLQSRKSPVNCCSIVSEYIIPADTLFPNYNWQAVALTEAKKKYPHLKLSKISSSPMLTTNFKKTRESLERFSRHT